MDSPPYSPPPESPIPPHPPLAPDEGDILDDLGPLDYFASDVSTTASGPSESGRRSESASATEITRPSDKETSAPAPRRARGGRRRRRGGRRGGRRASSLGTIVDVDEAGTAEDYDDDVAREKKRAAERPAATKKADAERKDRRGSRSGRRGSSEGKRGSQEGSKRMIKRTIGDPVPIPRKPDGGTPKLQIGLDLDVELELKAKLQGDISLALV